MLKSLISDISTTIKTNAFRLNYVLALRPIILKTRFKWFKAHEVDVVTDVAPANTSSDR
jgi:hypothetical protein